MNILRNNGRHRFRSTSTDFCQNWADCNPIRAMVGHLYPNSTRIVLISTNFIQVSVALDLMWSRSKCCELACFVWYLPDSGKHLPNRPPAVQQSANFGRSLEAAKAEQDGGRLASGRPQNLEDFPESAPPAEEGGTVGRAGIHAAGEADPRASPDLAPELTRDPNLCEQSTHRPI